MMAHHYNALLPKVPSMAGKVVAITGCTSGTGLVLAKLCAEKGASVNLLNRPSHRARRALESVREHMILSSTKNDAQRATVEHVDCDLTSFASVRQAAATLNESLAKLDVLVNNAGVMAMNDVATTDGCDIQMQVNHLSHFLLTNLVFPLLQEAAATAGEARIVNHSSVARTRARGKLDPRYFGTNGGRLGGDYPPGFGGPSLRRYAQTKLANVAFTYALDAKLQQPKGKQPAGGSAEGLNIKALVAHPGVCNTDLTKNSDHLRGAGCGQAPSEDGTCGIITCCCLPGVESGSFFGPGGSGWSGDAVLLPREKLSADALLLVWEESERSTGTKFNI